MLHNLNELRVYQQNEMKSFVNIGCRYIIARYKNGKWETWVSSDNSDAFLEILSDKDSPRRYYRNNGKIYMSTKYKTVWFSSMRALFNRHFKKKGYFCYIK